MTDLVNKFFHKLENGDIQYQGQIMEHVHGDLYRVEVFSWFDGSETVMHMDMTDKTKFIFYNSSDEMRAGLFIKHPDAPYRR